MLIVNHVHFDCRRIPPQQKRYHADCLLPHQHTDTTPSDTTADHSLIAGDYNYLLFISMQIPTSDCKRKLPLINLCIKDTTADRHHNSGIAKLLKRAKWYRSIIPFLNDPLEYLNWFKIGTQPVAAVFLVKFGGFKVFCGFLVFSPKKLQFINQTNLFHSLSIIN